MPVSFGSIGDIIAICLLVKDLVAALDESKGSATEYGEVKLELRALERALLEVEVLSRSQASTVKLNALYATARKAALDCRQPIEAFLNMIKKYDSSLGAGVSRNLVRNTAMKIRWRLSQKDEVARIRAEISAHSSSINMLLATVNVNLAQTHHKDMSDQLSDSSNRQNALIREVRDQLEETNALVSASHAVTNKIKEALKLKWFNQLGAELKAMMLRIININIATYNSVISIQEVISGGLQRSLTHEPFILEDAIGRISPVHLQFINSWDALDAVLELRFRKIQGHTKVKRREYILQEHSTKREISRTRHWEGAFLPGQRIDMSLIFDTREQSRIETSCPSCKEVSKDSQDLEIQCQNCGIWYRRVTELLDEEELPMSPAPTSSRNRQTTAQFGKPSFNDISYGPKPPSQFPALPSSPKRKLDCTQLEEDDLSQFKRIRLVSKEKRQKVGPFLSYPVGEATFNAAQQQKRDEQTGWDEFHALRSSLGDTHPDTLAYLHSFTRSLRNWGKYQTAEIIIRDTLRSGRV
ncbi:hypothetical protein BKA64DRAFT_357102 [Cadophora sp. MPI-SDFR-AT-0126]|nr:hypothetical protein BKA64DRAFT_357102 [Leotiomycetes sp. MPI-SDFR-AT-0126]